VLSKDLPRFGKLHWTWSSTWYLKDPPAVLFISVALKLEHGGDHRTMALIIPLN